uniref:Sulfatase domain-containing protein n=1 Tax=Strongyloides papillosus TaxID=174720 RepID=A0A0N5C4A9_STREA
MLIAIIIVSSILGFLILSLYFRHKYKYDYAIKENNIKVVHVKSSLHDVKDRRCIIPKLDIWNSLVRLYYKSKIIVYCGIEKNDWLYFDPSTQELKVVDEIKEYENDLICTVKYINKINFTHFDITSYKYSSFPISNLKSDFFDIECNINGIEYQWSKYFMRAIIKNEMVEKLRKIKKSRNIRNWNVQIISYGSLSQMAVRRLLPKTVKFFEKTLEGITLEGYNILGNETLNSFIPILTGKTESELLKIRKPFKPPFIWSKFSDVGYITLFGEDSFKNGTFSKYPNIYQNQTINHFLGTSFQYTEKEFGNECFRDTMQHKEWLDYSTSFIEGYNSINISRFSFLHHSSLSKNHLTKAENIDDDLYEYLSYNYNKGNFKNDVIILMSDHGDTSSEYTYTQQGQFEERLPFLGIRLPEEFNNTEYKKRILENLTNNRNALITPFDIYTTLLDIISIPNDSELKKTQSLNKRNLSIIKPIDKNRDCFNAQIEKTWCACTEWKDISNDDNYNNIINVLTNKYMEEINKLLQPQIKYCSLLKLDKILNTQWLVPNKKVLINYDILDENNSTSTNNFIDITEATYKIVFTTKPGGTTYEVIIHLNFVDIKMYVNMWNFSHLKLHDNLGYCMEGKINKLIPYCVCYDKISNKT